MSSSGVIIQFALQISLWETTDPDPDSPCSWLANQAGTGYIQMVNKINVGRRKGRIETPMLWYFHSTAPMDHNLWMAAYDPIVRRTVDIY